MNKDKVKSLIAENKKVIIATGITLAVGVGVCGFMYSNITQLKSQLNKSNAELVEIKNKLAQAGIETPSAKKEEAKTSEVSSELTSKIIIGTSTDGTTIYKKPDSELISYNEYWQGKEIKVKVNKVTKTNQIKLNDNDVIQAPSEFALVEMTIVNTTNSPIKVTGIGDCLYLGDKYYSPNYELTYQYNWWQKVHYKNSIVVPADDQYNTISPDVEHKYYVVYDLPKAFNINDIQLGMSSIAEKGIVNIWKYNE